MNSKKIIEDQILIYRDNFLKHKDSPLGTYQNDRETQHLRFEYIVKNFVDILNENISLHDLGCGVCDLHDYLNKKNIKHIYSGTEVINDMVTYARLKYPDIEILNRDVLMDSIQNNYDIVVFSGGLYLPGNINHDEWRKFVFHIVNKMFEMCNIGISLNLLSTYNTHQDKNLFFLDPKEMFDHCCTKMSRFVSIDQCYPLYEWTITVFRKEYILERYPQPEFLKYLKK